MKRLLSIILSVSLIIGTFMISVSLNMRTVRAAADYTYTATIDLSTTPNSTGTGYTVSGVPYAYDPRFLVTSPTGGLTFNAGAGGQVYHIIQTGVPNAGVPGANGKYGTSMILNIAVSTGVNDLTLVISDIHLIGSITLSGTAKINLILDGANYIRTSIWASSSTGVTIDSLNGSNTGDRLIMPYDANTNIANAAKIGGRANENGGTVTINGGSVEITARSNGAAIGGGGTTTSTAAGNSGNITINGGNVTVTQNGSDANEGGAGIGGGGAVTGSGGGVGGNGSNGGTILITGGNVTVTQATYGAGIGGGHYGAAGNITIKGGTVNITSTNANAGAAIGTGVGTNAGTGSITISGGNISAVATWTGIGRIHGTTGATGFNITISGGTVYAKGTNGPGIGYWAASFGDFLNITGGTVTAESVNSAAIGGSADSNTTFNLSAVAKVTAVSGGTLPAINAQDNQGNGYYVNATLNAAISASADATLKVYAAANMNSLLKTLTLPAKYTHFAYSSDLAAQRTDYIFALVNSGYVGAIVRVSDGSQNIFSVKTRAGYNAYGSTDGSLPVKLDAGIPFTGSDRYLVTRDSDGYFVGAYHYLTDAVVACGTSGSYTITATENDDDINYRDHTNAVAFPAGKIITLTSDSGGPYTLWQTQSRRHIDVRGTLTMKNIILDVSNPAGGGGIYMEGTLNFGVGAVLQNCADSQPNGAGVYVGAAAAVFNMTGGKIAGNKAMGTGGGVYVLSGIFTMTGGVISGNIANTGGAGYGGGVYIAGGTFNLSGGKITGNTTSTTAGAAGNGGGVWVNTGAKFNVTGPAEISGNKAPNGEGGGIYTANYNYADPALTSAYTNIGIVSSAVVSGNQAKFTRVPPGNASYFTGRASDPFDGALLDNDNINYNNTDYRVLYKANGGTGADYWQNSSSPNITAVTLATAGFTAPAHMTFKGWNTAVDGSGTAYAPGAGITLTGSLTLYAQWTPAPTTLMISKTVTGAFGDKTREFTFKITVRPANAGGGGLGERPGSGGGIGQQPNQTFNYVGGSFIAGVTPPPDGVLTLTANNDYTATLTLKHGQTVTVLDVPQNCQIQIVETSDPNYKTSFIDSLNPNTAVQNNDTGMLPMSADRVFDFTNNKIEVPPTGIDLGGARAILLLPALGLALALTAFTVIKVIQRKKAR